MDTKPCEYCGQEDRYGHNALCVMITVEELRAEVERLKTDKAGWEVEGFIDRLTRRDDTNSERLVLEAISHLRAFSRDCGAMHEDNRELRDEIERLKELVASLQASSGYEVSIAQLKIERLRAALRAIADDPDTNAETAAYAKAALEPKP